MSRFSSKLKLLIDDSGINIYQLAKKAQLDRTTIQRSIVGERLPSITFVEKLCDYLRVSPMERKELLEFYTISKVGEKVHASRKYIKDMIERIATMHMKSDNMFIGQKSVTLDGQFNEDIKIFSGHYSVNNLIHDILEEEVYNEHSSEVKLMVPFEYTFLFDFLRQIYLAQKGRISIKHIIKLSKNPNALQNSNFNLEILSNVIPFAFSVGNGYQPYYYYGNTDIAKDISLIMPYYVLTNTRMVTLSADFKTAILYNNEEVANKYRMEFENVVSQTKPFIRNVKDCGDILSTYIMTYKEAGHFTHNIEPQPCFAKYYTHQMIDEKLRQDVEHRDMILQYLYEFYDSYEDTSSLAMSIFSIDGLESLVNTGVMADLPPRFALPFTIEERKILLRSLRKDIEENIYLVRAINSSKLLIPSFATIQLYGTHSLLFLTADDNGIISSLIDEKSICESFYDFFESLADGDLLYDKEETLNIIDEFIAKLASMA